MKKTALALVCFLFLSLFPSHLIQAAFNDVSASHPYIDGISYVEEKGIFQGYPDGTFKPDRTINRAEFTKIIMERFFKANIAGENCFTDITNQWYAPYVCAARTQNIIQGYPDGNFRAIRPVSFVEATKIIVKSLGMSLPEDPIWYKPYVEELAKRKAIPLSLTELDQNITRGEVAEILYRLDNNIVSKPSQSAGFFFGISLLENEDQTESLPEEDNKPPVDVTPVPESEAEEVAPEDEDEEKPLSGEVFRANLEHTGVYLSEGPKTAPKLKWKFERGSKVLASPTAVGNLIYAGDENGFVFALDAKTGTQKWLKLTRHIVFSSLNANTGALYFGGIDGYFYSLSGSSGNRIWKTPVVARVFSAPTIFSGMVFFGVEDGTFRAFEQKTGSEKWRFSANGAIISSPAFNGRTLYFGSKDKKVYAVDAITGRELWNFKTAGEIQASAAVTGNTVYIGSDDTFFYALDASSGEMRWRFETEGKIFSSPAVTSDAVYFGSDDGFVYALDRTSGELLWKKETGGKVQSSPAYASGVIYVGSLDSSLYAFDAKDGRELWKYKTDGPIISSPLVKDGIIYFGSDDGFLYALE